MATLMGQHKELWWKDVLGKKAYSEELTELLLKNKSKQQKIPTN